MQLLLFETGQRLFALPAREVREVLLRPRLQTFGRESPPWLAGYFSLAGEAVPVLRGDRLLSSQGEDSNSAYTHLLLLDPGQMALSVERAREVFSLEPERLIAVKNPGRAQAGELEWSKRRVSLLSGRRLLTEDELSQLELLVLSASKDLRP